jgi:hypothetical protein
MLPIAYSLFYAGRWTKVHALAATIEIRVTRRAGRVKSGGGDYWYQLGVI